MSTKRATAVLSAILIAASPAAAQSFNIDLGGDPAGVPSSEFAAAGAAGFWNPITGLDWDQPIPVRGLDGAETSVTVSISQTFGRFHRPAPGTEGDDEALLDDCVLGWGPDIATQVTFDNLEPGVYDVYTYAWRHDVPSDWAAGVYVQDVRNFAAVSGGSWTGEYIERRTHAVHRVEAVRGRIVVGVVSAVWVRYPGIDYAFNGLQIERVAPVAATLTDLVFLDGTLISGGLEDLASSDDDVLETEARVTGEAHQPHLLRLRITADTDVDGATQLHLTIEGRITDVEAETTLLMRDWIDGGFVEVDQFTMTMDEEVHEVAIADAARFIRASDGLMRLEIKQIVLLPFTLNGFHTLLDQVELAVQ